MSKIEINDEMIVRYLTGNASPEEALAVAEWISAPGNRVYFDQFEATWRQAGATDQVAFNKEWAWDQLSPEMRIDSTREGPVRGLSLWPFGVAAAIIALLALSYFVFFTAAPAPEIVMGQLSTSDGFRFLELSDRSAVTLHRNTELHYPDKFAGRSRSVRLERGEAFFSVVTDADRPFIVTTQLGEITVTGTEFNVQLHNATMVVHVQDGRVRIITATDSATLTSGSSATISQAGTISVTNVPAGNLYSYATQRLVFDDMPLNEVIRDLENTYPNTIELRNGSLEKCRLTANFYKDDIDKIVNLIAETLNLRVRKDGRHFTLEGEGCL
jgi:ferric-dicitrate binding protein FerR (iron transport regulator)